MSSSAAGAKVLDATFRQTRDLSSEFRKYIGKRVSYATHGIHKYPAKFIPQIPRFCIESYSQVGDCVIDPFMGSGTTLLEAFISGRNAYGIDIHPLAKLIAKVKTTPTDPEVLSEMANKLLASIEGDLSSSDDWIPEIPNMDHWFRREVQLQLARIKKHIWALPDSDFKDFFRICLSSIVRRVSNSDDDSLIPEVTSFQRKLDEQGKTSYDSLSKFRNVVRNRLIDAANLWKISKEVGEKYRKVPLVSIIGKDSSHIELDRSSIDLAVTSPPYASAVHYVSVHKLEMYWLDLVKSTAELDSRVVGTARAYVSEYGPWEPYARLDSLREILLQLRQKDKKSAYIVFRYFDEMRKNLQEVNRILKRNGTYCVVAGENTFRRVRIPTYRILAEISLDSGFELKEVFAYDVINRHLDIPRWNDSRIERDHILVLEKRRGSKGEPL